MQNLGKNGFKMHIPTEDFSGTGLPILRQISEPLVQYTWLWIVYTDIYVIVFNKYRFYSNCRLGFKIVFRLNCEQCVSLFWTAHIYLHEYFGFCK